MDIGLVPTIINGELFYAPADDRTKAFGMKHIGEVGTGVLKFKEGRDLNSHNQFHLIIDRCMHSLRRPDGKPRYEITDNRSREVAHDSLYVSLLYEIGFTKEREGRIIPRSMAFDSDECTEEDAQMVYRMAYGVLCELMPCTMQELMEG